MKKSVLALTAGMILTTGTVLAGGGSHWGYTGSQGPEHWGDLDKAYAVCKSGVNQSPVNLTGLVEAELPAIAFSYGATATEVINNGHTIQANFAKGSSIKVDGMDFQLLQCHFHSPSENTIEGESFPMEGHCVHATTEGELAVVAIMYKLGAASPAIAALWEKMPEKAGEKNTLSAKVNGIDIMPKNKDYYRFNGSLTTPPCTEGVRWLVLKENATISRQQLDRFVKVMHHPNNRPVQPVNARLIVK